MQYKNEKDLEDLENVFIRVLAVSVPEERVFPRSWIMDYNICYRSVRLNNWSYLR